MVSTALPRLSVGSSLRSLAKFSKGDDLDVGEEDVGRQLGRVAAQQSHRGEAPGDDCINGHCPLNPLAGAMAEIFDLAAGLEHAVPVFDAPAQAIPFEDFEGLLSGCHRQGGQQEPFQWLEVVWRRLFADMHETELKRSRTLAGALARH